MQHSILFILLLAFVGIARGQKKANRLFQDAVVYYENGDYGEAAYKFETIVKDYPRYKYYDQCFYNTAYAYHQADSLDLAVKWYERIRASDLRDTKRVGGRGIFEPYANYKHYATFNIATIAYNQANYQKALDYYRQSMDTYPYVNSSGTDLRMRTNTIIIYITDCLEKLGKYEAAFLNILPHALDSEGSGNYTEVVECAIQLITGHLDKEAIKAELPLALGTLEQQSNTFSIRFRNQVLILDPYWLDDYSIDGMKTYMMGSVFWKALNKL